MNNRTLKSLGLALVISGAFGFGMLFMYFIMWTDVFLNHFLPMVEKVTR